MEMRRIYIVHCLWHKSVGNKRMHHLCRIVKMCISSNQDYIKHSISTDLKVASHEKGSVTSMSMLKSQIRGAIGDLSKINFLISK